MSASSPLIPNPPHSHSSHCPDANAIPALDQDKQDTNNQAGIEDGVRYGLYDAVSESDLEQSRPQRKRNSKPRWARGIMATVTPFFPSASKKDPDALPLLAFPANPPKSRRWCFGKPGRLYYFLLYTALVFFTMLGVIQFLSLACGFAISFFPDELDRATDHWRQENDIAAVPDLSRWPTDISRDIIPVGCHSHNDYWRRVPLYSALQAGCIGVEADVWLFDNELYVGHTTSSLTATRTLRNMYIDPLIRILDRQNPITHFHPSLDSPANGVFDTDPSQTVILLIDFKTDGELTWEHVSAQLAPFRERGYLTYFNGAEVIPGPITIVGTGNTPFNFVTANSTYRDIFFDAPLDRLADDDIDDNTADPGTTTMMPTNRDLSTPGANNGQGLSGISAAQISPDTFDATNSFYASVSFKKSIGIPWMFRLSDRQLHAIRAQIQGAHRRGLKARYWGTPSWPRSLRNHIWDVLVREGADILNVDDLETATRREWKPRIWDWWR